MTMAIVWFLLFLVVLGGLATIALLVGFIASDRSDTDLYLDDYDCPCGKCNNG